MSQHLGTVAMALNDDVDEFCARVLDPMFPDPAERDRFLARVAAAAAAESGVVILCGARDAGVSTLLDTIRAAYADDTAIFDVAELRRRNGGRPRVPMCSTNSSRPFRLCYQGLDNRPLDGNILRALAEGTMGEPATYFAGGNCVPQTQPGVYDCAHIHIFTFDSKFVRGDDRVDAGRFRIMPADRNIRQEYTQKRDGPAARAMREMVRRTSERLC